jgi:hypothetical protein
MSQDQLPKNSSSNAPGLPPPADGEVRGLGDLIKRVTSAVGIEPCGNCDRRAEVLNRIMPFRAGRPSR